MSSVDDFSLRFIHSKSAADFAVVWHLTRSAFVCEMMVRRKQYIRRFHRLRRLNTGSCHTGAEVILDCPDRQGCLSYVFCCGLQSGVWSRATAAVRFCEPPLNGDGASWAV